MVAVVHTHAPASVPFGDAGVPLKPIYHRSAFIASGVPVFDIREKSGMTDMSIRKPRLGRHLAQALGDHLAALMRGHGVVIIGPSLPRVVGGIIFLAIKINATPRAEAKRMNAPITFLDIEEA